MLHNFIVVKQLYMHHSYRWENIKYMVLLQVFLYVKYTDETKINTVLETVIYSFEEYSLIWVNVIVMQILLLL